MFEHNKVSITFDVVMHKRYSDAHRHDLMASICDKVSRLLAEEKHLINTPPQIHYQRVDNA